MEGAVQGTHSRFAKSLKAECHSRIVVDVLGAERIGRFRNRNVAEALSVLVA